MTRISSARIDLESGRVDQAIFKAYGETTVGGGAGVNSGSAYTVDCDAGNVFNLILTANCTFTFANAAALTATSSFALILKQDATGNRTVTWPASVAWANALAPTLSATAGRFDVISFLTFNRGKNWFGIPVGFNFS